MTGKPRYYYHADQRKTLYDGPERYHVEESWPWIRGANSLRLHLAQTFGKTPTLKTVSISRQRPRCFTLIELKRYSIFIWYLFLLFHSFLRLYIFQLYHSFTSVQPWSCEISLLLPERDTVSRPQHVVKLSDPNFCRKDLVEDLSTSFNSLLNGKVTGRLPCSLHQHFYCHLSCWLHGHTM